MMCSRFDFVLLFAIYLWLVFVNVCHSSEQTPSIDLEHLTAHVNQPPTSSAPSASINHIKIYYAHNFPYNPVNENYQTCSRSEIEEGKCFAGIEGLNDFFGKQTVPFVFILGGFFVNTVPQLEIFYDLFKNHSLSYLIHVIDDSHVYDSSMTSFICGRSTLSTNRSEQ